MPIRVCVVGPYQSGSTRLFNLVRLLYEKTGQKVYSGWRAVEDNVAGYDVIVSKSHEELSPAHVVKFDSILLPIRDVRDAAISLQERLYGKAAAPADQLINACLENIRLFNKYDSVATYIFIYEEYGFDYIKQFCGHMKIQLPDDDIVRVMIELDEMLYSKEIVKDKPIGTQQQRDYYYKTLLSQSHNTSGGRSKKYEDLSKEEHEKILSNKTIANFLRDRGYLS